MTLELSETARDVLRADGPVLVLGGPGAGKTTLSLLKAQGLIPVLEPEQQILFLSFSRAAVTQVATRRDGILSADERKLISVKTYHAFCIEVLAAYGRLLTGTAPRILFPRDEQVQKSLFEGDWTAEQHRLAGEESTYCFDQVAGSCARLLERSVCVRQLLCSRFPIVILDEFQDTSDSQWALVKQLAGGSRVITLADPDQRIFEYDASVDPERLNQLREFLHPAEFDLGSENHRSPDAGILGFADAVLRNRPLPKADEVAVATYFPNAFAAAVHAGVVWTLSALSKGGVKRPSVAVLCRTNALVSEVARALDEEHTYNKTLYKPVAHHVLWDPELAGAAAGVVASILRWPDDEAAVGITRSLEAIAQFYDLKNAARPSQSARQDAEAYRRAATQVAADCSPRLTAAKALVSAREAGIVLTGDPVEDWKAARAVVGSSDKLSEIQAHARLVPLLRATNEIGGRLAGEWLASGTYGDAQQIVQRALDQRQVMEGRTEPHGVLLMTMHKSKGKEFDGVVLVEGAHRGKFFNEQSEQPPYDASRRLLRVAITRARHCVLIFRPNGASPLTAPIAIHDEV